MKPGSGPAPPPQEVLDAWGVEAVAPLHGGEGAVYGTDDLVLKPVGHRHEVEWLARTLHALAPSSALRVVRPVPARDGAWVVAGWSAWERLVGTAAPERWRDAMGVSDRFHTLVADVTWSDAIGRHHAWARGDAFAWGEHELRIPDLLASPVGELVRRRSPVDLPRQLVHGDLGGNILFDEAAVPAVIDISPYWRPRRYADAIIVVDAMAWHGAGDEALESFVDPAGVQLLIRALLFRLVTASVRFGDHDRRLQQELLGYEPVLGALDRC